MTDRLALLMREEVDGLSVPPVPSQHILARGRRARRRRTQLRTAVVAAVAVACATVYLGVDRADGDRRLDGDIRIADASRAMTAYVSEGAYAVGDELVVGANQFDWSEPIKALHYTSDGVVIQSGDNPDRDEGGKPSTKLVCHRSRSFQKVRLMPAVNVRVVGYLSRWSVPGARPLVFTSGSSPS